MILLSSHLIDSTEKRDKMRKRFELPMLGSIPISEVEIPLKSRDELPPVLLALQTIYSNPDYHNRIFEIIEPVIMSTKSQRGREGMSIWEVIVLSVVRLTLNTNYDRLLWIANSDTYLRQLMGISVVRLTLNTNYDRLLWIANSDTYLRQLMGISVVNQYGFISSDKQYSLTALKENIGLLKLETIEAINALVLEVGQAYLKKKTKTKLSSKPIVML